MDLRTERLDLRCLSSDDVDDLRALWIEPRVRLWLWDDEIVDVARVREVVEASVEGFATSGLGMWAIRVLGSDALIGTVGFRPFDGLGREDIELLYGLHPDHWGRGYATEAARVALDYARNEVGLERVVAGANAPNRASIRVIERLGMTFEGRLPVEDREVLYYST